MRISAKFLASFLFASPLHADWTWKAPQSSAVLSNNHWVAQFTFHNEGTQEITAKELMFSCTCTEFSFKATPAKPGADGELRISLSSKLNDESLEVVVFGSESTTPSQLTIQIPKKPESALEPSRGENSQRKRPEER